MSCGGTLRAMDRVDDVEGTTIELELPINNPDEPQGSSIVNIEEIKVEL